MATKICPGCDIERDIREFYKNARAKDGRQTRCKKCQLLYQSMNREKARKRSEEWRRKNNVPKKTRLGRTQGGPGTLFPDLGDTHE